MSAGELVVVARLGRPHGVRGALRATATGPTLATLGPGDEVHVRPRGGEARPRRIAACDGAPSAILRLEGVETREQAAELTNGELLVPEERLPSPGDPDTFYVRDLIGFAVTAGGAEIGRVVGVHPAPANDALEVRGPSGEVLVPFTADAVLAVDPRSRTILVRGGLLEAPSGGAS